MEVPRLLKVIAGNLDEILQQVLLEWVESKDPQKQRAVAKILSEFNSGSAFYTLTRELVVHTRQQQVLDVLANAIWSWPNELGATVGPLSRQPMNRMEEIAPWLTDSNLRVRHFAKRMTEQLRATVERLQAEEDLRNQNY